MSKRVFVAGVGMTRFEKPQTRDWKYPDMAKLAGTRALEDAGIGYADVEQAAVGYVYGDSTAGECAIYGLGLTGIPVFNVNNNCATGSSALMLAKQWIEGGIVDVAIALGFEQMSRGSLGTAFSDRVNPAERHFRKMVELFGFEQAPATAQLFGNAGREHMQRYGTTPEQFARVAAKNHRHSVNNPNAQFQDDYTVEDILAARTIHAPLTVLQCSPTSDGAAAAIVCSEAAVDKYGLGDRAVEIAAMAMATDTEASFAGGCIDVVGAGMSRNAAAKAYAAAEIGPDDVDVIELHDCFSTNELITYEALGLCDEGGGGALIDSGAVTYGGRWVVNPSGGLITKGHPLGATGLAQCAELCWQLRGDAGARQVDGARVGLQHNLGLGGAAVVAVYRKQPHVG